MGMVGGVMGGAGWVEGDWVVSRAYCEYFKQQQTCVLPIQSYCMGMTATQTILIIRSSNVSLPMCKTLTLV